MNDRVSTLGRAAYLFDRATATLTVDQIGRTQSTTPEGYLLCEGVRIARTGPMLYRPDEVPEIEPDPRGTMTVMLRDADVLFAADTILSFAGKPVTNDHPNDLLGPKTWRDASCGTVLNPRRGEGADAEHLVADLLITDAECIADIEAGKREVSCGYDTEAEPVKPGVGRVTKIVGNHVALVDRGRCGPSCAIQDEDPTMAKAKKRTVWDRLVTAFHAKDEAAFQEELEAAKEEAGGEDDDKNIHVHVNLNGASTEQAKADEPVKDETEGDPTEARFAKIEAALASIAETVGKLVTAEKSETEAHEEALDEGPEEKSEEADEKKPVMDAAAVVAEFRDVVSRAEIIAPGIKLPAFDAKAAPKLLVDQMCGLRRRALAKAFDAAETRPAVEAVVGSKPMFDKMTCDSASVAFRAVSEIIKAKRGAGVKDVSPLEPGTRSPMTASGLQKLNEQRRNKR